MDYHRIPIDTESFLQNGRTQKVGMEESIIQNIHLLLITSFGESDFDPDFGCEIWDLQYDILPNTGKWTKALSDKLKEQLNVIEPRLKDYKVLVEVKQKEMSLSSEEGAIRQMRRFLEVVIEAKMRSTDEPFWYKDRIVLSPFSEE